MILAMLPLALSAVEDLSPAELFERAEVVLVAEVSGTRVRWGGEVGVETEVQLITESVAKGQAPSALELVLEGGALEDVRVWVEDVPLLYPGHRYRLYLDDTEAGWRIVGGETGAVSLGKAP